MWGDFIGALSIDRIANTSAGVRFPISKKWEGGGGFVLRYWDYHYSIAYVSRVRTKDGRVIKANMQTVINEARKLSADFSEDDLEAE